MPARLHLSARSHPGRTAAVAVALLLSTGALVAAIGGHSGTAPGAQKALPSKAMAGPADERSVAPSDGFASGGAVAPTAASSSAGAGTPAPAGYGSADAVAAPAASTPAGSAPVSPGVGPSDLGGQPVPGAVAAGTSKIVKNATLDVSVKKGSLGDSYQKAVDAAAAVGGWVQASQTATDSASLTLKVPSDKLEGVIGQIRAIGTVKSVSETGEDVTAEYVDLEARIGHWQAQEAVFVGLMSKARTIPETIQIQQQLSTIQEQIEQLEGRRKYLDGTTSFSTVKLSLLEEGAVVAKPDEGPKPQSTLGRAWQRSGGAALAVLGGTLVVLGVAVPLGVVVGIPAWVLLGLSRRRRSAAAPAAPPAL